VCLLSAAATVWAASKHRIPESNGKDVWRAVETQVVEGDEHVYVYSSLPLHPSKHDDTEFYITLSHSMHLLPLITLNIYHDIDIYIQSEFLDFTIWGMLGNYFNKNIETIEFENDILHILRQLEDLNERYQSLVESSKNSQKGDLVTLDKERFFKKQEHVSTNGESKEDLATLDKERFFKKQEHVSTNGESKDDRQQNDIEGLIREYIREYSGTGLTFLVQKAENPEKKSFEGAPSISMQSNRALSREPSNESVDKLLFRLVKLFHYLVNNKLEAALYFSMIVFLVVSTKRVVGGLKR
jgi:hypothetical protein